MTPEQRRILNAACGDLCESLQWGGYRLTKDDWRHLICTSIKRGKLVPGIPTEDFPEPGLILLHVSSLELSKQQASEAISLAFAIGDNPKEHGINADPIRWGPAVCKARFLARD